ncbi:endophilin-A2-like isoform X2 [Halichoeres trimaculatus]|uniref:endophilin-A2-like isoform X2 n=1 Tax=Halichoeres trimaculatus TaxID=147232 RepID=UPI003D9E619A
MSVAGLRKQFYKASQMVSEKVGGAEGTKLDEEFKDLERRADVTSRAVVEVITKTSEYLQPNPATRAKLSMLNTVSKIRGQVKSPGYPQPEGLLGECMTKYGHDMGRDTNFGGALVDIGESMKRLAEVKDSLDIDVKQNFIDPLQAVAEKDVKDIQVEQVSQLSSLVESLLQYHKQASQVLTELSEKLSERVNDAQSRPKRQYTPKPRPSFDYGEAEESNGGYAPAATSPPAYSAAEPCCKALYDFEPENDGELGFREGDIITLVSQIDENWFEGSIRGKSGYFPHNYVEVMVPL